MLVLSRRVDTSILIGHDITVKVEMVSGDDVCLRVEGPDDLRVERTEEVDTVRLLAARGKEWDPRSMHVLSRRPRPGLVINGEVFVVVQAVSHESVRIGIEAPPHVLIYREEVYQQMQDANRAALSAAESDLSGLAGLVPER